MDRRTALKAIATVTVAPAVAEASPDVRPAQTVQQIDVPKPKVDLTFASVAGGFGPDMSKPSLTVSWDNLESAVVVRLEDAANGLRAESIPFELRFPESERVLYGSMEDEEQGWSAGVRHESVVNKLWLQWGPLRSGTGLSDVRIRRDEDCLVWRILKHDLNPRIEHELRDAGNGNTHCVRCGVQQPQSKAWGFPCRPDRK